MSFVSTVAIAVCDQQEAVIFPKNCNQEKKQIVKQFVQQNMATK